MTLLPHCDFVLRMPLNMENKCTKIEQLRFRSSFVSAPGLTWATWLISGIRVKVVDWHPCRVVFFSVYWLNVTISAWLKIYDLHREQSMSMTATWDTFVYLSHGPSFGKKIGPVIPEGLVSFLTTVVPCLFWKKLVRSGNETNDRFRWLG